MAARLVKTSLALVLVLRAGHALAQGSAGVRANTEACRELLGEGELEAALGRCDDALREDARYGPARVLKVRTLVAMRRLSAALDEARAGRARLGAEVGAELDAWIGLSLLELRRYPEAREALERSLELRPHDPLPLLQLCKLHAMPGMGGAARRSLEACQRFLDRRPAEATWERADAEALMYLAQAQGRLGDGAGMARSCGEMQRRATRPADRVLARVCSMRALELGGRCADAVRAGVTLVGTRNPQVFQTLVRCHVASGQRIAAMRVAERYRAAHPTDPRAFVASAFAELAAGAEASAERYLRQALRLSPRDARLHAELGRVLAGFDARGAAMALARAAQLAPDELPYCLEHGHAWRAAGRLEDAAREHQRCVKLAPHDVGAWLELGADRLLAGDAGAAVGDYEAAVAITEAPEPARRRAREALANALLARAGQAMAGDTQDALSAAARDLERAAELDPSSPTVAQSVAVVRIAQGRPEAARKVVEPHVGRDAPPALLRVYARALELEGDPARALAALERAPVQGPGVALDRITLLVRLERLEDAMALLAALPRPLDRVARRAEGLLALHLLERGVGSDEVPAATLRARLDQARAAEATLVPRERTYLAALEISVLLREGNGRAASQRADALAQSTPGAELAELLGPSGLDLVRAAAAYADRDFTRAAALARAGLERRPDAAARRELAEIAGLAALAQAAAAYQKGELGRAVQLVDRARQHLDPLAEPLRLAAALLDFALGRREASARALRRLAAGGMPEVGLDLGIVLDEEGDPRGALEHYRRYVSRGGAQARQVRRWIEIKQALVELGAGS